MSTAGPRDIIAPCPFCGGTANVYIYECQDPFVGCNGGRGDVACDANGPSMPTEAEAIARWNRRTPAAGYRVLREGELDAATEALKDATAHLVGAASAYREHAARSSSVGRAKVDPFFTTRASDFDKAAERARSALRALVGEAK